MDRRLKERLVGATILVTLIVLIVPELLSGPKRTLERPAPPAGGPVEIMRNVTVDLAPSQASADDRTSSSVPSPLPAAAGRADPPPAAQERADSPPTAPADGDHTGPPVITTLKAQPPATRALENDAPTPNAPFTGNAAGARAAAASGPRRAWAVQIGSFVSRANADQEARRLMGHDRAVRVSASGKGASLRYRVRVGPFVDRAAAERAILKLRKDGLSASLIPP